MAVNTYSTDGSHTVMDTSGAKTTLNNLESTARAENHVGSWNANILESEMAMSVRSIIITVDRQHPIDGDTWGISWNQDNRLLLVWILVSWITLTHNNVDLASWITSST